MKKQTRNLLIITILFTIVAISIIFIFFQPEYRITYGFSVGVGMLTVCFSFYIKIWKTHKDNKYKDSFEIALSDERITNIHVHASYMTFQILLVLFVLASLIALFLHYELLSNLFMIVSGVSLIIYGICYFIYSKLY